MADKRLDQENVLSDFDYALIVKGNDVAKISKADLAAVVGELIGNVPFLGEDHNITDFNDIKFTCSMYCGNNTKWSNMPPGCGGLGGVLEAFFLLNFRGLQRFTDRYSGVIYTRLYADSWGEWKENK